jgi:ABC-type phosphate/phosphonate transport system substrate-binding protein
VHNAAKATRTPSATRSGSGWRVPVLSFLVAAVCSGAALAQPAAVKPIKMAVNDGRTGSTSMIEIMAKYEPLAEVFSRALGGRKVVLLQIREFDRLDQVLAEREFDILILRPTDRAARAVSGNDYRLIANARPDVQCVLLARNDSSLTSVQQVPGKRLVMGEPDSWLTRVCRADLRDNGIDLTKERVEYVREQPTIGILLDGKIADVGGVAQFSAMAQQADKRGYRVVHRSTPQPTLPVIASARLNAGELRALQDALLTLPNSAEGRKLLKSLAIDGFVAGETERMRELTRWLDRPMALPLASARP